MSELKRNDVVQISDETHPWYPCLLLVNEVKSWGVQACAIVPKSNDGSEKPAQAYNRLRFEQIAYVGSAPIGHAPEEED